jgi:hypothetical protein
MAKKNNYLINGLSINNKVKFSISIFFLIASLITYIFPAIINLNFINDGLVSIIFLFLAIIFSIRSTSAELFIIGLSIFMILNGAYDFVSSLNFASSKMALFITMVSTLVVELILGKVGIANLTLVIKRSMGVK